MAILVFALSVGLLAAGLFSGYQSLDLLPTSPGLVYAFAGAVALVGAIVVFTLGLLIARVGRLTKAVLERSDALAAASVFGVAAEPPLESYEPQAEAGRIEPDLETAKLEGDEVEELADAPQSALSEAANEEREDPVNENRAGHLPTLGEIERALEKPEPPPTLIGRYASGGANYMIFSDGSIEAETTEGAFKFASMGEFKRYLAERAKAWTDEQATAEKPRP